MPPPASPAPGVAGATDLQLLEAWQAGDREAGSEFLRRYFAAVFRFFATKVSGDPEQLTHDAFSHLAQNEPAGGGPTPRAALFAAAHQVLRSAAAANTPPPPPAGSGVEQTVQRALSRLSMELRLALELCHWEGFSAAELAYVLGISEADASAMLDRARKQLRERIARAR